MKLFSGLALRTKLALLMTLLIGAISLVIFIYFPQRLKNQATRAIVEKAYGLTDMAAFSVGPGLATHDRPRVAEALVGLRRNTDLVYLVVLDADGVLFDALNEKIADQSGYRDVINTGSEQLELVPRGLNPSSGSAIGRAGIHSRGGFSPDGTLYQTTAVVRFRGKNAGRIFMGLSLDRLNQDLRKSRATIALISFLIFTAGVLAVFLLSGLVTSPLRRIAQTAERISAGDMTLRAAVGGTDEIGQVAQSFNVMLDKLSAAQGALENLNRHLEWRVEKRTRALTEEIDERKRAETALRNSEESYRLLFERNLAGVYVAHPSGEIVSCNDACARIFGFESKEQFIAERGIIGYADASDRKAVLERLHREGTVENEEVQLWSRDGTTVWALESVRMVEGKGDSLATLEGILLDVSDRKRAEQEIEYKAYHDALTGLPNRRLFKDRLNVALAHARRTHGSVAVMFLDLDDLKIVNDTFGHACGDDLLRSAADRIVAVLREEDSVARAGGDEFTILLPTATEQEAAAVAAKVLLAIAKPFEVHEAEVHVTTSIGVAMYPSDGIDSDSLLRNADGTMYRVKELGGNDYQLSSRTTGRALGRESLEAELRKAIDSDQLTVFYQPQVDLRSRDLTGLEALVRWKHPDRVLIEPSGFIALAEQTGLIVQIGEIVLRKACKQLKRWQTAGFPDIHMAVNVSARQFHQKDFIGVVERVLTETELDPKSLELEITETMAMQKSDRTIRILGTLREMGISIAMDDFGTGQASISYLKKFPIDKVKIDRSFVQDVTTRSSDASIVKAILLLSNSLKLRTVAEGVETEEQCQFLQQHGCQEIQGYLISRPLSADTLQKRFLMHSIVSAGAGLLGQAKRIE